MSDLRVKYLNNLLRLISLEILFEELQLFVKYLNKLIPADLIKNYI